MIRPITCVTFLLACGSGLYLYQTKHKVHVLDAQIEQVADQTEHVREQIRVLHAEWTLLDQPDRLQQLTTRFLALQPTKPTQFSALADLDARLPAPLPAPPRPGADTDAPTPVAEAAPLLAPLLASAAIPATTPAEPVPAPPPAVVARVSHAVLEAPAPRVVRTQAPVPRVIRPRLVATSVPRPVRVYPTSVYPTSAYPTGPYRPRYQPPVQSRPVYVASTRAAAVGGSMLGMARDAASPPAPTPVTTWTDWNR